MSKNNDDQFLGGPVRFNEVGRKASDPTPADLRPAPKSAALQTRTIVTVVLLIVFATMVYFASTHYFGVSAVSYVHHSAASSSHTLDTPAGF